VQFADRLKARSEPIAMDRKHDGDAMLILCHEARQPVDERAAGAKRQIMKLMSLVAESHATADRHVDCARALATPFGRHGVTGLLPNVVQYICAQMKLAQA
jgi:hypothetical protein